MDQQTFDKYIEQIHANINRIPDQYSEMLSYSSKNKGLQTLAELGAKYISNDYSFNTTLMLTNTMAGLTLGFELSKLEANNVSIVDKIKEELNRRLEAVDAVDAMQFGFKTDEVLCHNARRDELVSIIDMLEEQFNGK